jgi:hypothetical protein
MFVFEIKMISLAFEIIDCLVFEIIVYFLIELLSILFQDDLDLPVKIKAGHIGKLAFYIKF